MRLLSELMARARSLFWVGREERELRDEIAFHIEKETEKNVAAGMTEREARRQAHIKFGGVERMRERTREARGVGLVTDLVHDLRYAGRRLRHNAVFSAVAISTIAVAVGANTTVFSVLRAVLLQPLPYADSERVVTVHETSGPAGQAVGQVAPGTFFDWREGLDALSGTSAYQRATLTIAGSGYPEAVQGARVSSDLLPMLGVAPELGRVFSPEEEEYGRDNVVVLSHRLWQRRFGGDPDVLGRDVQLADRTYSVVGVMPQAFQFPDGDAELWVPMTFVGARNPQNRAFHFLDVVARLDPQATLAQAQAEIELLSGRLAAQYPVKEGWSARVDPMLETMIADARPALIALLASVGLVLLIACANLAAMLLVRGAARSAELATRVALGAGRQRVARQLLTESLLLAAIGGAVGLLLAHGSMQVLPALIGNGVPRVAEARLDASVFGFGATAILLTGLGFGLVPAWRASTGSLASIFRGSGRALTGGRAQHRARNFLVVGQICISVTLLIGAGLLVRSMYNRSQIEPGFEVADAYRARVTFPPSATGEERLPAYQAITDRLRNEPAIEAVGIVHTIPTRPYAFDPIGFAVGGDEAPSDGAPTASEYQVTPGYFSAMGIPLEEGRVFTGQDAADAPKVVVINETMARLHFPDRTPIGARIRLADSEPDVAREIIGIVGDVRTGSLTAEPPAQVYLPFGQLEHPIGSAILVVRVAGQPGQVDDILRQATRTVRPDLPVSDIRPLQSDLADAIARERLLTWLLTAFASFALGLAALGVYGVVASSVQQRSRELSVRLALGAEPNDILFMVTRLGARLAAWGVATGLLLAILTSRILGTLLYDVGATDPITFVTVPLALAAATVLATYVPARRASRVQALKSLRGD